MSATHRLTQQVLLNCLDECSPGLRAGQATLLGPANSTGSLLAGVSDPEILGIPYCLADKVRGVLPCLELTAGMSATHRLMQQVLLNCLDECSPGLHAGQATLMVPANSTRPLLAGVAASEILGIPYCLAEEVLE